MGALAVLFLIIDLVLAFIAGSIWQDTGGSYAPGS
jgi:hypothetical protein